ncbi:MAG TPA: hypothetical protein VK143_07550 [Burkholderiales bacterium]|nr:hypothetical protein [Burkholderiales bacterium]
MKEAILCGFAGLVACFAGSAASAQTYGEALTAMPQELEIKYALSAVPPHLRDGATVYVLDLGKGYVVAREGTNGFHCFVARTEYAREHFGDNVFVPVGYDPKGSKTYMPVYFDVARLRIEGKMSPEEVNRLVEKKLKEGSYRSPARPGIAFMIAPVMTGYKGPGSKEVMTMSMPHFMFYAPNMGPADFGAGRPRGPYPYILDQGPLGYMILNVGDTEKANIVKESDGLLKELCSFRTELCIAHTGH